MTYRMESRQLLGVELASCYILMYRHMAIAFVLTNLCLFCSRSRRMSREARKASEEKESAEKTECKKGETSQKDDQKDCEEEGKDCLCKKIDCIDRRKTRILIPVPIPDSRGGDTLAAYPQTRT